ncbi:MULTISPECIES: hypothetical protein [Pseudoalteromonas]|uniref:Uncharacterized protein n=1 Tax=Pseudoalteromonas amylolytica TaxID=1859457 RepID=A0A1S1N0I6_9GAMM|nr:MULTISPECIES: hypothetical protein [Pseudoalteromonas]OHU88106.1 hypothetical protein BFC16_11995 [Pseudoalteromonas sp. JW3]OHU91546.1 hypothetical protein BET10_12115 [Pseudoalteromonas amylolytica]
MSTSAYASVCSSKQVVTDKCTIFKNDASLNRKINKFIGDMHSSCNKHDRAYNTLGADRGAADRRLQRDLRKDCLDNPFTMGACLPVVELAMAFVRSSGKELYLARQNEMLQHVKGVNSKMAADQCVATPEHQGYIDDALLSHINSKFKAIVSRPPTAYERYEMLSRYVPGQGIQGSTFNNSLTSYAYNRRGINAPVITSISRYESVFPDVTYTWNPSILNKNYLQYDWSTTHTWGNQNAPKLEINFGNQFDMNANVSGFLKVKRSRDERDVFFFSHRFTARGSCSPSPDQFCTVLQPGP